ncbi:hypothetical protein ACFQY7_00660 [Actinomadura luteofluorescens]|uniref:hypothetical protein n=1 Tax=Actinomadura luteofluorescens TaxID=46163 RepID=UPI003638CF7A
MCAAAAGASGVWAPRRWCLLPRRGRADPAEAAALAALHLVAHAAPPLRAGLTGAAARRATRLLRSLLGAEAVAIVAARPPDDPDGAGDPGKPGDPGDGAGAAPRLLAWDGTGRGAHAGEAVAHALPVLTSGRPRVIAPEPLACGDPHCGVQVAMIAPSPSRAASRAR